MTDSPHFTLDVADGIGVLRITRKQKKNALSNAMIDALIKICGKIEKRDDIAILILTGEDDVFCAGGDITEWSGLGPREFAIDWVRRGHAAFDAIARLRQPVIAVINGHALGGGLELAAAADYRIAETHCKIGQPETGIGIIPGWSGTQRMVRRFGAGVVRRMAMFGEVFDAKTARALGIVDVVAETGKGMEAAMPLAAQYLGRGRQAGEVTKMLINAAEGEETERVLESLAGYIAASGAELREGVAAFREKRKPDFAKTRRGKK